MKISLERKIKPILLRNLQLFLPVLHVKLFIPDINEETLTGVW